jgi:hypothetical protein
MRTENWFRLGSVNHVRDRFKLDNHGHQCMEPSSDKFDGNKKIRESMAILLPPSTNIPARRRDFHIDGQSNLMEEEKHVSPWPSCFSPRLISQLEGVWIFTLTDNPPGWIKLWRLLRPIQQNSDRGWCPPSHTDESISGINCGDCFAWFGEIAFSLTQNTRMNPQVNLHAQSSLATPAFKEVS